MLGTSFINFELGGKNDKRYAITFDNEVESDDYGKKVYTKNVSENIKNGYEGIHCIGKKVRKIERDIHVNIY